MGTHHFQTILTTLLVLAVMYKAWKLLLVSSHKRKEKSAPEPLGAWPLIGHILLLNNQIPAFQTFGAVADKHGPIFSIRFGTRRALVISSWEAVKECFNTNDKVFLNRPLSAASKFLGYNEALFALTPYGKYWRQIRKISVFEHLSSSRVNLLKHIRSSEVEIGIRNLYCSCCCCHSKTGSNTVVNISEWVSIVAMNMMIRMMADKRLDYEESRRFNKTITKFMYLIGTVVISDMIPFTEWLDLQGHVRSMKSTAKDLEDFMRSWIEEHFQNRRDGQVKEEGDFIDAMISSLANQDSICGHMKETVVQSTALNLIIGGTHTTSLTLTWALSLLLNNPKVLKHAQEELDNHTGGSERWVEESDFKNLPYLQAIIKETLRLYPAVPLSIPRESIEDCFIGGFHVRKGTMLFVNMWKLHRDPRVWLNPNEFQPERFLTGNDKFDFRGQHFEYIPFGSGRRYCPGMFSSMQIISLMLARILQGFNLSTPMDAPVDVTSGFGATLTKATPLEVILTPRLPYNLYQF